MPEKRTNLEEALEARGKSQVRLVLASMSPRRKELLEKLGLHFETFPSHIDEDFEADWSPEKVVLHLAEEKGRAVRNLLSPHGDEQIAILSADTIVVCDGEILNKPADDQEAHSMLEKLSGRSHEVFTGVVLLFSKGGNSVDGQEDLVLRKFEKTVVTMRAIGEAERSAYVLSGEPRDKAGAYAIQGIASAFVARIDGCFSNVVGLPLPTTVEMLRSVGIKVLGA